MRNTDPDGMIDYNDLYPSGDFGGIWQQTSFYDGDPDKKRIKPTAKEAQRLADIVNGNATLKPIGGWKPSNIGDGLPLNDPSTGLVSAVFEKTMDGETGYAYVTAGTQTMKDVGADIAQTTGSSKQYAESVGNARKLDEKLKSSELTFIGYSKGGGQAAADALATGRDAITFNAAAVSSFTKSALRLNQSANIVNYEVPGDRLVSYQALLLLRAEGTTHTMGSLSIQKQFILLLVPDLGWGDHLMKSVRKSIGN